MNNFRFMISNLVSKTNTSLKKVIPYHDGRRWFCEPTPKVSLEKNIFGQTNLISKLVCQINYGLNRVTLLGRVGINPQLRGSESKPVVVFTLATNKNYKDEDEIRQKTDWHRITVFRGQLQDTVIEYLRKGNRIYVEGRLSYSEYTDEKGIHHYSSSIIANDIIFFGNTKKEETEENLEEID